MNTSAQYPDDEVFKKLLEGLKVSYARLVEYKRSHNQQIAVIRDGHVVLIDP
jgi:hypothetical protein